MANHLTPTELAEEMHMKRRDVLTKCIEMHVPILKGRDFLDGALAEAEVIVDAESGEDVEVVLGVVVADDDGVALEDGVGGVDGGVGDGEVGCPVWGVADGQGKGDAKDQKRQ